MHFHSKKGKNRIGGYGGRPWRSPFSTSLARGDSISPSDLVIAKIPSQPVQTDDAARTQTLKTVKSTPTPLAIENAVAAHTSRASRHRARLQTHTRNPRIKPTIARQKTEALTWNKNRHTALQLSFWTAKWKCWTEDGDAAAVAVIERTQMRPATRPYETQCKQREPSSKLMEEGAGRRTQRHYEVHIRHFL